MDKRYLTISEPEIAADKTQAQRSAASREPIKKRIGWHTIVSLTIYLVAIPAAILIGVKLFADQKYNIISIVVVMLACVPFFIGFERGNTGARELVVLAVMTAISVVGRVIFAPISGFKPVTAIVIITAIAFGMQAGFLTGALSAVVSNFFYGQGPWTPFQMFAWGFIGLLAGLLFKRGKKPNALLLGIVGAIGGVLFSVMMDIWIVFSADGIWNWSRYWGLFISGLLTTAVYALSNIVFLLLLTNPFLSKLNRVKIKYGLFAVKNRSQEKWRTSKR